MDENKNTNETQKSRDFGYIMGRMFGFVLTCCLMAIAITTTIRIISWIL